MYDPEYHRAYREENKEKIRAYKAAWHARNKDRIAASRPQDPESKAKAVKRVQAWVAANKDRRKAYVKRYQKENAEKIAETGRSRYRANGDVIRARCKAYREANPEKARATVRESGRKWREKYPERTLAYTRNYQARKANRTPAWLTDDDRWVIEEAYELARRREQATGFAWHVDHIIPLHGKNVCGLHVPTNLQVIPAKANIAKSNHYAA